jgi:F-type H+-transporting ATPase subunit epsilon|tara:strand:- start:4490 stop:4903 length:414 start_codon:yes stop_codon:yes gene_type:complete
MATTMHCDIVSAEKSIFSGLVEMVVAAGSLGDLGIAPGHAPLLTALIPGPVKLTLSGGEEEVFYVSGGFLEVQRNTVTLLTDTATRAGDVDEAAAIKAMEDAEKAMANQGAEFDYSTAAVQLAEAAAQLRALRQIKK